MLKEVNLGRMAYSEAYAIQKKYHECCVNGEIDGVILRVEHENVYTLGKNTAPQHLPVGMDGVGVIQTERGGQITAHMPGQLVVYPILRLDRFGLSPRRYVKLLERVTIDALRKFGIDSRVDPKYPGVWVRDSKIAAIGIRIKERATLHGISINVCNSFDLYSGIVPCGIFDRGVTSVCEELRKESRPPVAVEDVYAALELSYILQI